MPQEQRPKKLLDQMRDVLHAQHYSLRTEDAYVDWAKRFILFHQQRHPAAMGRAEIEAFLTHLAVERHVAASTQNQALSALLFLYKAVLHQEVESVDAVRARKPTRLPTVLTKTDALRVIHAMVGVPQLLASCSMAAVCGPSSVCACGSKMSILRSMCSSSAMAKATKIGSP